MDTGSPAAMKFLCDRMLTRLGKWLRTAGYDTEIADPHRHDTHLIETAEAEGRVFLTCDRRMIKEREPDAVSETVVLLSANDPDTAARELTARLKIDWLYRPLSRCTEDNTLLHMAGDAEMAKVPKESRPLEGPVMTCPTCHRVYWRGTHTRRMLRQLEKWQAMGEGDTQTGG